MAIWAECTFSIPHSFDSFVCGGRVLLSLPIIYLALKKAVSCHFNVAVRFVPYTRCRCYIKSPLVRFLCFFIPGLVIISSNAVLFFFIAREIHETLSGAPKSDQRTAKKELRVYISIFISIGLSWIFGYLMFLLPFPIVTDIFFVLFSITTPLQGLFIFAFYTVNAKVLAAWMALFGKCGIPFCAEWSQRFSQQSTTFRSGSRSGSNSGSSSSSSSSSSQSGGL